jgi:hypothetical protein
VKSADLALQMLVSEAESTPHVKERE